MKDRPESLEEALRELDETRVRLAEAEDHLRAFAAGEVDAIVAAGPDGGEQVYTLRGADYTQRVLTKSPFGPSVERRRVFGVR
jgi:diacylglycerol kinase family enzyme